MLEQAKKAALVESYDERFRFVAASMRRTNRALEEDILIVTLSR